MPPPVEPDLRSLLVGLGPRVAMVDGQGRAASGDDLAARHDALVESAQSLGATSAHRLAMILPDHPGTALAILTLSNHLSVLPLNPDLTLAEQVRIVTEAAVDAIVSLPADPKATALATTASLPLVTLDPDEGVLRGSLKVARVERGAGLVLLTSGSTGSPKRVPLTHRALWLSARTIAQTLRLGPDDCAGHAMPMFHIGALVDLVLAPWIAGGSVALARGRTPDALCDLVLGQPVTWLQLVPTMLARCVAEYDPATAQAIGARLRFIRSVSADLAPARQAEAEALFGTALVQMYGMTETAGQIASNPVPPGLRKPGSVGLTSAPEVRLLDPTGSMVPQGAEGEICIQGESVTEGYENTPRTEQFHGRWLRSGDLGRFDEEGYLFLTGRVKDMINRGGEKIAPIEVERAALTIPGVVEAVAYAVPHPTYGEQVGLSVTVRPGSGLQGDDVAQALGPHLAPFKQPRRVEIRADLPRLGSGKIDRAALRREASEQGARAPQSPLARKVGAVWADVLRGPLPHPDEDFFEAGGDSLSATAFLLRLDDVLGHPVPGNLLFEAPRFGAFVERLAQVRPAEGPLDAIATYVLRATAGWPGQRALPGGLILGTGTSGALPPAFFCAQGSRECRSIRSALNPDRPLYLLRSLYLMQGRSPATEAALMRLYADEVDRIQPDGPLFLGGFCAGARIMSGVARILWAQGREIGPFLSIDFKFTEPTPYPVLHVWTDCPIFPASAHFARAEMGLPLLHPAGGRIVRVEGVHTRAMTDARMVPVGVAYEAMMSGTDAGSALPAPLDFTARQALQVARLEARLPRVLMAGRHTLAVRVTNLGPGLWPSGPGAAFSLAARFLGKGGSTLSALAGSVDLPEPLAPGATVAVTLEVKVPRKLELAVLEVAMVDQGVGRFAPNTSPPLSRRVLILPLGSD